MRKILSHFWKILLFSKVKFNHLTYVSVRKSWFWQLHNVDFKIKAKYRGLDVILYCPGLQCIIIY